MEYLNWIGEHWFLVVVLVMILSATYTVPKMVCGIFVAMITDPHALTALPSDE